MYVQLPEGVIVFIIRLDREQARRSESSVRIGCPSEQDGPISPARDFPLWSLDHMVNHLLINVGRPRCHFIIWLQ